MTKKKLMAPPLAVAPAPIEAPLSLPRFSKGLRLLLYPLAVLAPSAGLVLGLLYARQDDAAARSQGRWLLACALLGSLLRLHQPDWDIDSPENLIQPFY